MPTLKKCIISLATEADANNIAHINITSWKTAYQGILPDNILNDLSTEDCATSWRRLLQNKPIVLKATLDNELIGFSFICRSNPETPLNAIQGEIRSIYLHPDTWGKGYGRALCLASIAEAEKLGCKQITCWSLEKNSRALKFYESLGFSRSGASRLCPLFPEGNVKEVQYILNARRVTNY